MNITLLVLPSIENLSLFAWCMVVPLTILKIMAKVKDEERVLEMNEDIASINSLFTVVILVSHILYGGISISMIDINLIFYLCSTISTWNVLDTEVSPQVLSILNLFNINSLLDLRAHTSCTSTCIWQFLVCSTCNESIIIFGLDDMLMRLAIFLLHLALDAFNLSWLWYSWDFSCEMKLLVDIGNILLVLVFTEVGTTTTSCHSFIRVLRMDILIWVCAMGNLAISDLRWVFSVVWFICRDCVMHLTCDTVSISLGAAPSTTFADPLVITVIND